MTVSTEETTPTEEREKGLTAGQRLAAAKAAKAAAKAGKRGQDGDVVQQKALAKAAEAGDWYEKHRVSVLGIGGTVLAVAVGLVLYSHFSAKASHASGSLLWDAVETAQATIRPAGSSTTDYKGESFESVSARAKEALADYRSAIAKNGKDGTISWATLGEASALLDSGDYKGARAAFEKAQNLAKDIKASPTHDFIALRAAEGIAFTYEGEKAWDKAASAFAAVASVGTTAAKNSAAYNGARVTLAQGDRAKATEQFKKLYEDLTEQSRKIDTERTSASPEYELGETEERLRELSPGSVKRSADFSPAAFGAGGGGANGISQEELQRILKQLQEQQGQQPAGQPQ